MALNYLLDPMFQIENSAGKPATEGWLEVYLHGTRTKYYCASDFNGTLHPFKIPLDSLGSNIVLADDGQSYDVYAYNRFGSLLMSRYNVHPGSGGSGGSSGTPGEMQHWLGMYGPTYTPFPGDNAGHTLGISKWEIDYVGDFIDRIETCPYPDGTTPNGYIYLKPGLYYVSCIIRYQQADDALSNTLDEILMYTGAGNANESLAYQMDSSGPEATGNRHNVRVQFIRKVPDNVSSSVLYFAPGTPVNWKEAYIQKLEIIKLDSVALSPTIVQGLEKVAHDDTMTGDGTILNPLSIQSALDEKQDTLIPGEHVEIDSDGAISVTGLDNSNIFWAIQDVTTYEEVVAAREAGKRIVLTDSVGNMVVGLTRIQNDRFEFVYFPKVWEYGGPTLRYVDIIRNYGWYSWDSTIQADWNQEDARYPSFIRGKPNMDNYQKKLTAGEGIDLDSDGNISVDTDDLPTEDVDFTPLVAGHGITIEDSDGETVISATGEAYSAGYGIIIDSDNVVSVDSDALPTYTPGEGINIDSDGIISVDPDDIPSEPVDFSTLVPGHGITIEDSDGETVISATGEAYSSGYGIIIDSDNVISVDSDALPTYTPGEGINIDSDGVISVDSDDIPSEPVDFSPLVAGRNITIEDSDGNTVISAADAPVYTAGENIEIDSDGVISAPDLQKELIPGDGIELDSDGNISIDSDAIPSEPVELSPLVAGSNIIIEDSDGNTVISADVPVYTAGLNIEIDSDNVISATGLQKELTPDYGIDLDSDGNIGVDPNIIPELPPILPLVAGENVTLEDSDGMVVISADGGGEPCLWFLDSDGFVQPKDGKHFEVYGAPSYENYWDYYYAKINRVKSDDVGLRVDYMVASHRGDASTPFGPFKVSATLRTDHSANPYQGSRKAGLVLDDNSTGTGTNPRARIDMYAGSNGGYSVSTYRDQTYVQAIVANDYVRMRSDDIIRHVGSTDAHAPFVSSQQTDTTKTYVMQPTATAGVYDLVEETGGGGTYTAGENIEIDSDGVISAPDVQKKLTAGNGIELDSDGLISVDSDSLPPGPQGPAGTVPPGLNLVAGNNISITPNGNNVVISAAGGQSYTPGTGIDIDSDGVISADSSMATKNYVDTAVQGKQNTLTGITDVQVVAALPASPVSTVLYLIPEA